MTELVKKYHGHYICSINTKTVWRWNYGEKEWQYIRISSPIKIRAYLTPNTEGDTQLWMLTIWTDEANKVAESYGTDEEQMLIQGSEILVALEESLEG